jgi:hypothetical protein
VSTTTGERTIVCPQCDGELVAYLSRFSPFRGMCRECFGAGTVEVTE